MELGARSGAARCGVSERKEDEGRLRRVVPLAPRLPSSRPLLARRRSRSTQQTSTARPRATAPRPTPSLALAPPHLLEEHTPRRRHHLHRQSHKMSSMQVKVCLVCGVETKNRCSSCAKAGIDLFFCSADHQALVRRPPSSLRARLVPRRPGTDSLSTVSRSGSRTAVSVGPARPTRSPGPCSPRARPTRFSSTCTRRPASSSPPHLGARRSRAGSASTLASSLKMSRCAPASPPPSRRAVD